MNMIGSASVQKDVVTLITYMDSFLGMKEPKMFI